MARRISVGLSSCLMGNAVRYDGRGKPSTVCLNELASIFELVPVCPEVGAGLSVPRPPIQLIKPNGSDGIRACGVQDASMDVTDALHGFVGSIMPQLRRLAGFVVTERSPSCGYGSTPLIGESGQDLGVTNGLFVATLLKELPELPIIESAMLENVSKRQRWVNRVVSYHKRWLDVIE